MDVVEILSPYRSCSYSWDEPLGERALVVERLVGRPPRRHRGRAVGGAERDGTSRDRVGGAGGDFPSVFVGVYGLDLLRPPAVVGRLRIGVLELDLPSRVGTAGMHHLLKLVWKGVVSCAQQCERFSLAVFECVSTLTVVGLTVIFFT